MPDPSPLPSTVAVIGGGPAGLMAAEIIAGAGVGVMVFDRMPSLGRKLLMAGRGGLNLTHSEDFPRLLERYGEARPTLAPALAAFPPADVIAWCEALGQPTFVGSSGRVFPRALKASPLLRAWLARLVGLGVQFRTRHDWRGWTDTGALRFATPGGEVTVSAEAAVLALGGASWPRLGADGSWVSWLPDMPITPLRPANCGFAVAWSSQFRTRFEGTPLKRIALGFAGRSVRGEAMITEAGLEGGAVYALSAPLRDAIAANGPATITIDLRPDLTAENLAQKLKAPRRGQSLSTFLRKTAGLPPVAVGLVQEARHNGSADNDIAPLIKSVPVTLLEPFPLARAISSAGGLALPALDAHFMLRARPGTFAAGEMLDWEAPTGGYLLQAAFSTGSAAGRGVLAWLKQARPGALPPGPPPKAMPLETNTKSY